MLFAWNQQEEAWWIICYGGMGKEDAARYLRRWGTETDIRSGKDFLPSTNSVKPDYRYLLVFFAFLLFNFYFIARYWRDETIDGLGMVILSLVRKVGVQLATALDLAPLPRGKITSRVETKEVKEVIPF